MGKNKYAHKKMKIKKNILCIMLILPFSSIYIGAMTMLNHVLAKKIKKMLYLLIMPIYFMLFFGIIPIVFRDFFDMLASNSWTEYLYYYLIFTPFSIWLIKKQESILENNENENDSIGEK